ncbi:MAG TPA: hypothetical protein VGM11_10010, partial [Acidobacteriaceae bacterium]
MLSRQDEYSSCGVKQCLLDLCGVAEDCEADSALTHTAVLLENERIVAGSFVLEREIDLQDALGERGIAQWLARSSVARNRHLPDTGRPCTVQG